MNPSDLLKAFKTTIPKAKQTSLANNESDTIAANPDYITEKCGDDKSGLAFASKQSNLALARAQRMTRNAFRSHIADLCVVFALVLTLYGIFRERTPVEQHVSPQVVVSK